MAINFPDPSASPWYNDPANGGNGVTYVYTSGGYWTAVQVTGTNAIDQTTGDARYVNVSGDSMTGGLNVDGNVGIGTTSPEEILHVAAASEAVSSRDGVMLQSTSALAADTGLPIVFTSHVGTISNYGVASIAGRKENGTSGDAAGYLQFATGDSSGSLIEKMRIDSSGNVGIGDSSPDDKLHVNSGSAAQGIRIEGSGSLSYFAALNTSTGGRQWSFISSGASNPHGITAGYFYLRDSNSGDNHIVVDTSGNVGIGVTSNLAGSGDLSLQGNKAVRWAHATAGTQYADIYGDTSSNLVFRNGSSSTERMRIDSSGNVGIGTTSPLAALDVKPSSNRHILLSSSASYANNGIIATDDGGTEIPLGIGGNPVQFFTGATERMRIDSSGRLLVGLTSDLSGGTTSTGIQLSTVGGGFLGLARNDTTVSEGNGIGGLRFYSNDPTASTYNDVGIIQCMADGDHFANDYPTRLEFHTTADGASSPTERMRILSDGKILFGTTIATSTSNSGITFVPSTNGRMLLDCGTTVTTVNQVQRFFNGNGQVGNITTNGTATAFNTSSDYRLKENVTPVTDGITRLQQLKPSRFNFIADAETTVDGFLAHEAQAVVPEAITGTKDEVDDDGNPVYQGIDQSKLVPLLTAALQEAIAKIETLEQRLTDAGL